MAGHVRNYQSVTFKIGDDLYIRLESTEQISIWGWVYHRIGNGLGAIWGSSDMYESTDYFECLEDSQCTWEQVRQQQHAPYDYFKYRWSFSMPSSVRNICDNFLSMIPLERVNLNNGLKTIGNFAFDLGSDVSWNYNEVALSILGDLNSIDIPDSVEHIGLGAFRLRNGLVNIKLPSNYNLEIYLDESTKNLSSAQIFLARQKSLLNTYIMNWNYKGYLITNISGGRNPHGFDWIGTQKRYIGNLVPLSYWEYEYEVYHPENIPWHSELDWGAPWDFSRLREQMEYDEYLEYKALVEATKEVKIIKIPYWHLTNYNINTYYGRRMSFNVSIYDGIREDDYKRIYCTDINGIQWQVLNCPHNVKCQICGISDNDDSKIYFNWIESSNNYNTYNYYVDSRVFDSLNIGDKWLDGIIVNKAANTDNNLVYNNRIAVVKTRGYKIYNITDEEYEFGRYKIYKDGKDYYTVTRNINNNIKIGIYKEYSLINRIEYNNIVNNNWTFYKNKYIHNKYRRSYNYYLIDTNDNEYQVPYDIYNLLSNARSSRMYSNSHGWIIDSIYDGSNYISTYEDGTTIYGSTYYNAFVQYRNCRYYKNILMTNVRRESLNVYKAYCVDGSEYVVTSSVYTNFNAAKNNLYNIEHGWLNEASLISSDVYKYTYQDGYNYESLSSTLYNRYNQYNQYRYYNDDEIQNIIYEYGYSYELELGEPGCMIRALSLDENPIDNNGELHP